MFNKEANEATNKYLKMCMSINGAVKLQDGDKVIVKIPKSEFTYLKLAIQSDDNNPILKFYKEIDDKTVSVHNVLITF